MSLYKRIFLDNDPAYAAIRNEAGESIRQHIAQFQFRIARNRKNRLAASPRWDPSWRYVLDKAVKELGVESVNVNEGILFRTAEDREAVKARAEVLWEEDLARRRVRREGSVIGR